MKRLAQWLMSLIGWESHVAPAAPPMAALSQLRLEHEHRMEAFNRALAAAIQLRDLLVAQTDELQSKETNLRSRLRAAIDQGDERLGAELAAALRDAAVELNDAQERLSKARDDAEQLTRLRDQAIVKAQARFQEASELAARGADNEKRPDR